MAVVMIGGAWLMWNRPADPKRTMRFISRLPEGQNFAGLTSQGSAITISRDGSEIVYVARQGKELQLWRRGIGDLQATPIAGTEGGRAPFLSPDSAWVGFSTGREIKRVSAKGGSSEALEVSASPLLFTADILFFGGSWDPAGDPIYIGECTRGLRRFSLKHQTKEPVTDVFSQEQFRQHQFPQVLPGGDHILFTEWLDESKSEVALLDLKTGAIKRLISQGTYGRYLPSGHIVYAWEGDLYAVPFDLADGRVDGPGVLVVEGILMNLSRGAAHFDVSDTGTLVYIPGDAIRSSCRLAWVDSAGRTEIIQGVPRQNPGATQISPDGSRVLLTRPSENTGQMAVWVYEFERGVMRQLTEVRRGTFWPVWAPDSRKIVFTGLGAEAGEYVLLERPVDAVSQERVVSS